MKNARNICSFIFSDQLNKKKSKNGEFKIKNLSRINSNKTRTKNKKKNITKYSKMQNIKLKIKRK